ncbi:putative vitamin B6 transporter [Lindgomyces ingoldianus]|uniref:Vitamin B6 transporter n=1 Tax=Lindgomyces ingoldianus TaxID=673940 RepID=A0ACB6QP38_9PLEO|nr:putative vitamin B6 transporter [Lindgomyces ingoldianus]KAF2468744.1 putative vitamin B6 transporter [Lindgomyces ingoldianus]
MSKETLPTSRGVEKNTILSNSTTPHPFNPLPVNEATPFHPTSIPPSWPSFWTRLNKWNSKFEALTGVESRGISRVSLSEREPTTPFSYLQIALLWVSCDLTANGITLAMLGPLVFELSFADSTLCCVFGAVIGSIGPAYISTWGPRSGHRTMIVARWFMGYYPAKLTTVLSLFIMLGYGTINCIIVGQILSAVNGHGLSLIPGILVVAGITLVVAVFGMHAFHAYERYAWLPQVLILFILVGSAGPGFNTSISSTGSTPTIIGHRLSYLTLCMSSPLAWSASAADYFVYYHPTTPKRYIAASTYIGNVLAFSFAYVLGAGLASGISTNPIWSTAYKNSQGALILAGFSGLGSFGSFCGVVLALGIIADNIAATYSAGLAFQMLDHRIGRVPRWILTAGFVGLYTACALGGRKHLFDIFQNFLALMGYWTGFFFCIVAEEHTLFRGVRNMKARARNARSEEGYDDGFDWNSWDDWKSLPVGVAALIAFLIGWAGAVVCMNQEWYVGPIAKMVGKDGIDLGLWVGTSWTLLLYPVLRVLEIRTFGR